MSEVLLRHPLALRVFTALATVTVLASLTKVDVVDAAVQSHTIGVHTINSRCSGYLPAGTVVGMAATPDGDGYWITDYQGQVVACGNAPNFKSLPFTPAFPVVGMAVTPDGQGFWLVASDGGVFSFGDAGFYGSTGGLHLNKSVVGMASTPDGHGYWLVAADGGIFSYGDARFYGSTGSVHLNQPVVGMSATPDGLGYWLVAADGGVFAFGEAGFYQSMGGRLLNRPVVGMASSPDAHGYWLVASDGGIFAFGDAAFYGSTGSIHLNDPIVEMAPDFPTGGYWLVASDGGTFAFNAPFLGSAVAPPDAPAPPPPSAPSCAICNVPVTPDGTPYTYTVSNGGGTVTVMASATTGENNREFFWSPYSPYEAYSTVCATFSSGPGIDQQGQPDQQGILLRLNDDGGDNITGITVMRNIIFDDYQIFNFHVWNVADTAAPYEQFGATSLSWIPFAPPLYPLSMCARIVPVVSGSSEVQFVVWYPEPTLPSGAANPCQTRPTVWGDTTCGGEAALPSNAPEAGQGGFYAGHLVPGTSMTYTNLMVDGAVPVGVA
jgi:hypothetical protein